MIRHIFLSILLSLLATIIMSYISMATPIGPWIAPTLLLILYLIYTFLRQQATFFSLLAPLAAGSVGGIIATAIGFSYPALYFINPPLFNEWIAQPYYFIGLLGGLVSCSGWLGIWAARSLETSLLSTPELSFPISQLLHKMMSAPSQIYQAYQLAVGVASAFLFGMMQKGYKKIPILLPSSVTILPGYSFHPSITFPALQLDMSILPMLLAIGFVTGHVIALPLVVGTLLRYLLLNPIAAYWFAHISSAEFLLAFCSGMVVIGAAKGIVKLPLQLYKGVARWYNAQGSRGAYSFATAQFLELAAIVMMTSFYLSWLQIGYLVQMYVLLATYTSIYVMVYIAAKIGLAQLGRFATFVMVPAMLFFKLTPVQLIIIATFVEIAGGVAVDILFSKKVAQLGDISLRKIEKYQYFGLILSVLSVGIIVWLLVSNFQLGSAQLAAPKAQARMLLLEVQHFNIWVLLLGMVMGQLLHWCKINPSLVLSGLLMPITVSMGLIFGGLLAAIYKKAEQLFPFWSGVFAGNSIWMLLSIFK